MYISINSYSTACQKLLLSVCEELLLPVPVELGGSPISMSPHDVGAEESPSSTTCEETNDKHSLPNEMPTSVSSNTRSLVRCASFQDKRQITVPSHKQKVGHSQEDLKRVCGEAGKSNKGEYERACHHFSSAVFSPSTGLYVNTERSIHIYQGLSALAVREEIDCNIQIWWSASCYC
jgi:hypothetical protein